MKSRPILFSAPMVRAILEGRKTQTRRVVKIKDHSLPLARGFWMDPDGKCVDKDGPRYSFGHRVPGDPGNMYVHERVTCPYGLPGDRMWVRETWGVWAWSDGYTLNEHIEYRADRQDGRIPDGVSRWRPSIHMPRKHSRITLEITGIRVDRLQEISEEDAMAEGVDRDPEPLDPDDQEDPREVGYPSASALAMAEATMHRRLFSSLWERIHGAGSWDANPWVWIVEFRRVEARP